VLGILSLWLRQVLPVDLISSWSERLVGLLLIGIGLWGLRQALTRKVHAHEHTHDGITHVHVHFHDRESAHEVKPKPAKKQHAHSHAALSIGCLHGLAGGSHFFAIIPALAFPTTFQAGVYLIGYGVGTVIAMICFSSVIGELARRFSFTTGRAYTSFLVFCSVAAMGLGGYWLLA
jgi:sulfite exporter TauE/SafE